MPLMRPGSGRTRRASRPVLARVLLPKGLSPGARADSPTRLLETLENRTLFSSAALTGGILTLTGNSSTANILTVAAQGSQLLATVNGASQSFNAANVSKIVVSCGSAGDLVNIDSAITTGTLVEGGTGNDTITGGSGTDTIYGMGGNDFIDGGAGNDFIDGGTGDDVLLGSDGNDTLFGGAGNDLIDGRGGTNLAIPSSGSDQTFNASTATGPTIDPRAYGAKLDGVTDDTAAIQAAMNALPATGGTLVLNGMAAIGSAGVVVAGKSNVNIIADTAGAGFRALSGTTRGFGGFSSALLLLQSDTNATVAGITIDGNNQPVIGIGLAAVSNSTITGNEIYHTAGTAAIASSGGTSNTYSSNSIHDTPSQSRGMWIGNCNNDMELSPLITGNTILRTGATGIGTLSHNAIITNNTSSYTLGAGLALAGVTNYTTVNAYVANNVMNYNGYQGIQADAWSTTTPIGACTLLNNTCIGNSHSGIYVARSTGWTVQGNTCDNNGSLGGSGICVTMASSYITVLNNICSDTRTGSAATQDGGVELLAQAPNDVVSVTVQGNYCSGNRTAGVLVHNSYTGTMHLLYISNNTSNNNQLYGLFLVESSLNSITGVTLSGNTEAGNSWDLRYSIASP